MEKNILEKYFKHLIEQLTEIILKVTFSYGIKKHRLGYLVKGV